MSDSKEAPKIEGERAPEMPKRNDAQKKPVGNREVEEKAPADQSTEAQEQGARTRKKGGIRKFFSVAF